MNQSDPPDNCAVRRQPDAPYLPVLAGVAVFFAYQYGTALWRLAYQSRGMDNKFSALARDKYVGFIIGQNLHMIIAYAILAVIGAFLLQPFAAWWTARSKYRGAWSIALRGLLLAAFTQGYCTLRLVDTRPYFLNDASFGNWFYRTLDIIPAAAKPDAFFILFKVLPIAALAAAFLWQIHRRGRRGWLVAAVALLLGVGFSKGLAGHKHGRAAVATGGKRPPNILILASDSLRGDKLGCAGYRPAKSDGAAAPGVSPTIDALAARSVRFERCYTPIASTMESGISLMTSQYPQTHGVRQMYPDRATVEATMQRVAPMAKLLGEHGYETAAIGDWCAGYYHVAPLGFEDISVSTFDNFKIYMSQAVVMAHFVVPLYFDNALGYRLFPQIESFAQFVTPEVVTARVEARLAQAGQTQRPFFWHVFFSCNHLPYRSQEPYCSLFSDPAYRGRNKNGVDFDIDSFIGGTDLESKWKALPAPEATQIRALYDGCTRQFDDCVGRVLAALKRNGLEDNTIVIVTADHGDDLYEPGVTLGHGLTFNGGGQANHVPMIMHIPGVAPRIIPETVRMLDIMPTLADWVGVKKPSVWQGQSFAGWLKGGETPVARPFYGETGFPFIQFKVPGIERPKLPPMDELTRIDPAFNYQFVLKDQYRERLVQAKQRCLRTHDWKLVCTPTVQGTRHFGLFFLPNDPHGEHDLASTRPEVLAPLQTAIEHWIDDQKETSIAEIFPAGEPQ
ncbi:MAG: sulfatase [Verrucomicrobiota bacterium]